ncbi:MAG TPA: formaldehyde-activating enzyme [Acidimicrobiales bacterium]|nr:formaldehyde-activating enzyme [Acidimicrobiales bacterium]
MEGLQIGEAFVGVGENAAHVNTVLGDRLGPAGVAWVSALASPSVGHTPFVAVLAPGVAVKPLTLFVNKAPIGSERHGNLTWGAAQAGVAAGVADAVADGLLPAGELDQLVLIAAVWVSPAASDDEAVFVNNRVAARGAVANGASGGPGLDEVMAVREYPHNPFFDSRNVDRK